MPFLHRLIHRLYPLVEQSVDFILLQTQRFITRYLKNRPTPEPASPQPNGNGNNHMAASSDELVPLNAPVTRSILGQKYWKSQQQSSTVTGKYLRPMCEVVAVSAGMLPHIDHRLWLHGPSGRSKPQRLTSLSSRGRSGGRCTFCKWTISLTSKEMRCF